MAETEVNKIPPDVPVLTEIFGDDINKKFQLTGSQMRIGRNPNSHIVIDHPNVSRTHCVLFRRSEGWFIKDNASQNGTYVNGTLLPQDSAARLRFGDIIFLGPPASLPTAFSFDDTNHDITHVYLPGGVKQTITADNRLIVTKRNETARSKNCPMKKEAAERNNKSSSCKDSSSDSVKIVSDTSNLMIYDTKEDTARLCTNGSLKRTVDALKPHGVIDGTPRTSKISPNIRKSKKNRVECSKNAQNEVSYSEGIQDNYSQSLLDISSDDLLDNYPFSQQLDSACMTSDRTSDSLNSITSAKHVKTQSTLGSVEDESEHLKSKLAALSEEIKKLEKSKLDLLKEYEDVCQKNKVLDEQLTEQKKLKEDLKTCELRVKNSFKTAIMEKLEEDLICHICTELLIKPTVLDCSHTFCEHCIAEWKKKKKQCPICRNSIQNQTRVLALDHFIDKTLETLTPDQKEKRQELISQRERSKIAAAQARRNKRSTPRGRRSRRRRITERQGMRITERQGMRITVPQEVEVVEIFHPEESIIVTGEEVSDELSSDDSLMDMFGVGPCYNCGEYGHLHYHCPY